MQATIEKNKESGFKSFLKKAFAPVAYFFQPDANRSSMSNKGRELMREKPDEVRKAFYKHVGVKEYQNVESEITLK